MKFDVIYADPPWDYGDKRTGGGMSSGASQKYPTMAIGAIQQIPVAAVAQHNAVLALWCTSPLKFSHGYTTAVAWGFPKYVATLYWDKQAYGLGRYFRGQVEELLLFVKGDVAPFGCQRRNMISSPRLEHSEKPEEFRRIIEDATKKFNRRQCLELFARKRVSGWTGAGNQVTGRDIREDVKLLAGLHIDAVPAWPDVVNVR